jgi:hypothetical protein
MSWNSGLTALDRAVRLGRGAGAFGSGFRRLGQIEVKHRLYDWASFDLEALQLGECKSFVAYREM